MPADGNCLFGSIALGLILQVKKNASVTVQEVREWGRRMRQTYLDALRKRLQLGWRFPKNPDLQLELCVEASSSLKIDEYMSKMKSQSEWGGWFETGLLACKYDIPSPVSSFLIVS